MEFQFCPKCGKPREHKDIKNCAYCGFKFFSFDKYQKPTKISDALLIILGIILFALILGLFYITLDLWMIFACPISMVISFLIVMFIFGKFENQLGNFDRKIYDKINPNYKYIEIELKRIEEERELKKIKVKAEKAKQSEAIQRKYEQKAATYDNLYGICNKIIPLKSISNKRREIRLYIEHKYIILEDRAIAFESIMSYSVSDRSHIERTSEIEKGNSFALTKTDNSSMLGRAAIGGLLLGGTGAIIGGSTANRTTSIYNGNDIITEKSHTSHDYTINVNVNDIINPIVYVWIGKDEKMLNEVTGLLNVIINNNRN